MVTKTREGEGRKRGALSSGCLQSHAAALPLSVSVLLPTALTGKELPVLCAFPLTLPACAGVATHTFRHLSWLLTLMVCLLFLSSGSSLECLH